MFGFNQKTNWEKLAARMLFIFFLLATIILLSSFAIKVYEVFVLFLLAILLKYLLDKPVYYLRKLTRSKTIAIFTVFFVLLATVFVIGNHSFPIITKQVSYLKKALPNIIDNGDSTGTKSFKLNLPESVERIILKLDTNTLEENLQSISENLAYKDFRVFLSTSLLKSANILASIIIVFVMCFYLLMDGTDLWHGFELIFPKSYREHVRKIKLRVHKSLEAFIQGQFQIAMLSAFVMYLTYVAISAKFPIILGVLQLLEFIPVLGTWIAIIPALIVIYLSSGASKAMIVLTVYLIYTQLIRDMFIAPRVYGDAFKMHPIFVIMSIIVGAKLAGIIGVILSFPIIAMLSGIIHYAVEFNEEHS